MTITPAELDALKRLAESIVRERSNPPKCVVCGRDLECGRSDHDGLHFACYAGANTEPDVHSKIVHADRSARLNPKHDPDALEMAHALPKLIAALEEARREAEKLRKQLATARTDRTRRTEQAQKAAAKLRITEGQLEDAARDLRVLRQAAIGIEQERDYAKDQLAATQQEPRP